MPESSPRVSFKSKKQHKLDPKGRISFPKGWRVPPESTLFLLRAMSRAVNASGETVNEFPVIKCYTETGFDEMLDKVRRIEASKGRTEEEIGWLEGEYATWSEETEVSSQDKMLIPKEIRETLHLDDMVMLAGRGDHFEMWNPEDFAKAYPSAGSTGAVQVRPSRIMIESFPA